jgi:hypothetical protein
MQVDAYAHKTETPPGDHHPDASHRPHLTTNEFRQLGMFRVAYLTGIRRSPTELTIVLHGADGMAITMVDNIEAAVGLADQLGVTLVAVH